MSESGGGGEEGGGGDEGRPRCPYPPCADPPTIVDARAKFCAQCGGVLLFSCKCGDWDGKQRRVSEEKFCPDCGREWYEEGLRRVLRSQDAARAAELASVRSLDTASVASDFTVLDHPVKSEASDEPDDMEIIDGAETPAEDRPQQPKQETPEVTEEAELDEIRMDVDVTGPPAEPAAQPQLNGHAPGDAQQTAQEPQTPQLPGATGDQAEEPPSTKVTYRLPPSLQQATIGSAKPGDQVGGSEVRPGEAVVVEEKGPNGGLQTTFGVSPEAAVEQAQEAAELMGTQDFAETSPAGQSLFGTTNKPSPAPRRIDQMSVAAFVHPPVAGAQVTPQGERPMTRAQTAAARGSSASGGESKADKARSAGDRAKEGGKAKSKTTGSKAETVSGGGSKAGGVKVRFVVLMPEDTLLPHQGSVGVVFGDQTLGGWKRMHQLRTSREQRVEVAGIPFHVYVGRVDIPKDLCSKHIEYKYILVENDDDTFVWEFINSPYVGYIINRTLRIPESAREKGQFNCMDGFFDVKDHPALAKPGILGSLAKKAGSLLLGKENIKPRFQRSLLHYSAAFKFFLPLLDSQGFFLAYDPKTLKPAKTRLGHLDAVKALKRVCVAFSTKFCKGKDLFDLEIFTDRFLETLTEYKAAMVEMAEEGWVTKIVASLVLLSSLASRQLFPLKYEGVKEEVTELLQLLRIPTSAPPASVADLKLHLVDLDKSRALCPEDIMGGGLFGLIHTSYERARETRSGDDDPVIKGLLAAVPLAHIAVPPPYTEHISSDPKLTYFWAMPNNNWSRSGGIGALEAEWVKRMQELDPHFVRSVIYLLRPSTEQLVARGFHKIAPLDSLAWIAFQISKLGFHSTPYYYRPWVLGLEKLDEVNQLIKNQPTLIGVTTPEEAETIACHWVSAIKTVLGYRGMTYGSLTMDASGALKFLGSVLIFLDTLASHPTLGARINASQKVHDDLEAFLRSWKLNIYSYEVPIGCVTAMMDVELTSSGVVKAVWEEWVLQKLKAARIPPGQDFEKLVKEMELLGRVKSAEGQLKAALDERTTQLLDSMVASAVNADHLDLIQSRMGSDKLRDALSSLVNRNWPPADAPEDDVISCVLTWSPLQAVKLFGLDKLTEEMRSLVETGLKLVESLVEGLQSGGASLASAERIRAKQDVVTRLGMAPASFFAALGALQEHRASLKDKAHVLGLYFPASLEHRPAVLGELEAKLSQDSAVPIGAFGQFFQTGPKDPWEFQPNLYGTSAELDEPLGRMAALINNALFQQCWAEERESVLSRGEEAELSQICEALLRKALAKAKGHALRFLGGRVSAADAQTFVSRLEQVCPNYLDARFQEDFAEFGVGLPYPEWQTREAVTAQLLDRKDQIIGYTQLRRSQELLKQLHSTSEKLRLSKVKLRLSEMLALVEESGEGLRLAEVELGAMREVETALASVAGREELLRAAFLAYDTAQPLIVWAKSQFAKNSEPLKSTDLDTFKDLADSGDDQEKSGLIRDFGSALEAFGPLVYGLPQDPDFGAFAEMLGDLVESLDKEPKGPEKLVGVSVELARLESLLDAALSMEKTKVDRVKEIMTTGHFELHCHGGLDLVSPDTLLTLHYQAGDQKKDSSMDLASVKDLHSNLLLIAAQLKEDAEVKTTINRFSRRMELVLRFLELFLEHWRGGNLFLASVRCRFYLAMGRDQSTVMDFEPEGGEVGQRLIGKRPFVTELEALCDFLSGSREAWLDFVRQCRLRQPALDLFTNRQIVRLRQKLAQHRAGERGRLDLELEMLLSLLKHDVSAHDLNGALQEAAQATASPASAAVPSLPARRLAVLEEVYEMGRFSREDAARALLSCPEGSDATDLILWLEEESDAATEAAQPPPGAPISQMEQIRALAAESAAASEAEQVLDARLAKMFRLYLTEQVKDQRLAESIGIGELGRVLGSLWVAKPTELKLPTWVEANQQNLVVVKEAEVLRWALSVYERSPGAELSQSDVLVCAATTTEEDVELFVRRMQRASIPEQNLTLRPALYTVLFVERLTSQVAQTLDRLVRSFVDAVPRRGQDKPTYFGLVFFCSQEHYETSHLAGLTTKFRRSLPEKSKGWPLSLKACRAMVAKRLGQSGQERVESAQAVLVTSVGYGQGKSLAVRRITEGSGRVERIPVHDRSLNFDLLWKELHERLDLRDPAARPPTVHLDISDHRTSGIDSCLFQLLLLGGFTTPKGKVWRLRPRHRFVLEMTSASNGLLELRRPADADPDEEVREAAEFRFALPLVQCHSPALTLELLQGRLVPNAALVSRGLDESFETSEDVERCVRHLGPNGGQGLDGPAQLALLLEKCGRTEGRGGVKAPSWLELTNFVRFLGRQLSACDANSICLSGALPGFTQLVLFFSVEMARDFATRSLKISEEVACLDSESVADHLGQLESYSVKREWERNPHPYLFFNPDLQTFSFFGCIFKGVEATGRRGWYERVDLVEPKTGAVLQANVMPAKLFVELKEQLRAHRSLANDLSRPFDEMDRPTKLRKLYSVLVVEAERFLESAAAFPDPDPNYELTMDCALKILAMEMRFRCGIPVVVMGETGCGKTRLLQFYAQAKRLRSPEAQNLLILRVHGGTDAQRLCDEVAKAKALSQQNWTQHRLDTILFLDEANTTREMCLVKEVVLERSLLGRPIEAPHLLFAIALNPYKRHSDKAIQKLENAGLGYHVQDMELLHRFDDGAIPMRQLVYRVHPLPPSLVPLAWDFGFLSSDTEDLYIHQMLRRALRGHGAEVDGDEERSLAKLLCDVQHFRKAKEGESSFVSLRDVERALKAFFWFLHMDKVFFEDAEEELEELGPVVRSAILSVGLCYRSSLQEGRRDLDRVVRRALGLGDTDLVGRCVDFVAAQFVGEGVKMEARVAKNEALRENVFVMAVTAQLSIPLFLVGKPGSSKSLGKTILAENMKGSRITTPGSVYRHLKDLKFVSYQCSPLSTAEGVAAVFRECAKQQERAVAEGKGLEEVGVIPVLDEVGMAEESEKMPLKALHGLLEEGSAGLDGEEVRPWHHTGFVGISNWALDPAKMNRGIFLSRALPDHRQLIDTARCICDPVNPSFAKIERFIEPLTQAYLEVYRAQDEDYEFYGLRDFYSMMKQLAEVGATSRLPSVSPSDIAKVIQHNFSGQRRSPAFDVFAKALRPLQGEAERELTPRTPVRTLVEENLRVSASVHGRRQRFNRFLLVLTQNNAALRLLQSLPVLENAELIFGSRFPQDLEYTQICRDINRIRLCMEKGRPVILLNLETLYESLYDLLNQSFVEIRGDLFVDIGLGTHRHQTKVHADFRLVVLAEVDEVRRSFPSALVNRLEKLSVFLYSDMTEAQTSAAEHLSRWTEAVVTPGASEAQRFLPEDVFVGYAAEETPFALVADAADRGQALDEESLRRRLMQICVPEGVLRVRESEMGAAPADDDPAEWALDAYCAQGSSHVSLRQLLPSWLTQNPLTAPIVQLTTYQSQLLSKEDCAQLAEEHGLRYFETCQLQDFGTEQAFAGRLREVFRRAEEERSPTVVVIQCIAAQQHPKLISTCQHRLRQLREEFKDAPVYVGLCLLLHRLPFLLNDRVGKWAASGLDQFLHVSTQKPLSDGPQLDALADAADLRSVDDLHFVKDLDQAGRQRSLRAALDRALARAEDSLQLLVLQFYHRELRKPSKTAGEMRAEIGQLLETKGQAGRRVKVVLVTTVPATAAFPGRGWDSWHLDSLVQDSFTLPDLRTLRRTRPSQLLSDSSRLGFPAGDFFQKCIVETVARIKEPREGLSRLAEKMVKGTDGVREEVQRRIAGLLAESEEALMPGQAEEWVYRVAKNARSLVDSRSFERALLKHLEQLVSPLLAGFVCALDANSNLSLAFSAQPWKSQLWLDLLQDPSFVPVRLSSSAFVEQEKTQRAKTEFASRQEGWEARFPFSWLVAGRVEELLAAERELGSAAPNQRLQSLQARLEASHWGRHLIKATTMSAMSNREMLADYIRDFVRLRISTKGLSEFELAAMMESLGRKASEASFAAVCPVLGVQAAFEELGHGLKRFESLTRKFPGLAEALGAQAMHSEPLDLALSRGVLELLSAPFLTAEELEGLRGRRPGLGPVESLTRAETEEDEEWLAQRRSAVERWSLSLTGAVAAGLPAVLAANRQHQLAATLDALKVARTFLRHTAASPKFFSAAPVFKRLNDTGTDVRSAKFLQYLVKMLKLFGDQAFGSCFPKWKACVECGRRLERREALAVEFLPCRHPVHGQCLRTLLGRAGEAFCPADRCGKRLGADPWEEAGRAKAKAVSAYAACRDGLRNFFLDLLADSVFAGSQPPPADVIQLLLDLTLPEDDASRPLSPIPELGLPDDSVVLRASILQHLLRYKSHAIADQLSVYYRRSQSRLTSDKDRERFVNMCVRCVEDAAERELAEGDGEKSLRERWELGLELAADNSADQITRIGRTKAGISLLARLLPQSPDPPSLQDSLANDETKLRFLLRCLVHVHGLEKTLTLLRHHDFDWVPRALGIDLDARPPLPDAFLCYGDEYKDSRSRFLETLTLRGVEGVGETELSLAESLALTKVAWSETAKAEWTQALPGLVGFAPPKDEDRQLEQVLGHVAAAAERGLAGLGEVFRAAARDPGSLRGAFLLAMPEDKAHEVLAAVRLVDGPDTSLNQCPNGHRYLIGNCGRPYYQAACMAGGCVAAIGGASHQFAAGNTAVAAVDQTKPGLCLPLPGTPAPAVVSEREGVSPLESTLLRLLQHLSLLLAATSQPQAVGSLFAAEAPADPEARLQLHVRLELHGISEKLGRSLDDTFYLLHLLLHRLNTARGLPSPGLGSLQTKEGRQNYEASLAREVVRPVLAGLETRLGGLRQLLLEDTFHGDDLLLRLSYAAPTGPDSVWAFHRPATLASLRRELLQQLTSLPVERQADLGFLRQLFEQMEPLSSLRHLPDIVRLQDLLRQHFERSVCLQELDGVSIADFLLEQASDQDRAEIRRLLPVFFGAYKECQSHSRDLGFIFKAEGTEPVLITLPQMAINWARLDANPLELLLPIPLRSRPCLLGFGLPRLLARIQNDFLEQQGQLMAADGAREALGLAEALGREAVLRVEPETRLLPSLLLFRKLEMKAGEEEAEEAKFHLAHLQRSLEGGLSGRGRRLRAEWELELSSERLVRSQRRLAEAGQSLSRAEREALLRAFQREDLATLACALRSLELLSHFLKGGEAESLGDLATAFSVPAAEGLGGLSGAQLVDAWTTLKVHQTLLMRQNGSEAHPAVPEALLSEAFSSEAAEAGARAAVEGGAVAALHRLLTRFLLLYAQRLEQRSAEAQTALLGSALVGWVGSEVHQADEGLDELAELSDDLLVSDLLPLHHLLAEHRLNQPLMQLS